MLLPHQYSPNGRAFTTLPKAPSSQPRMRTPGLPNWGSPVARRKLIHSWGKVRRMADSMSPRWLWYARPWQLRRGCGKLVTEAQRLLYYSWVLDYKPQRRSGTTR